MNPKDLIQIKYGEWWEAGIPDEVTVSQHNKNVKACLDAIREHNESNRPLKVLAVHGSSRSSLKSAAQELSNSQMLLRAGLEPYRERRDIVINEVALKEYNNEPCENCYSTSSALCGFPCNCFPWDPMQKLYPLVLKCDVMLCSTGVNQSAMSSRLKIFLDRLISLDGGFFVGHNQYESKGPEWREKCLNLAISLAEKGELHYDARMWGKVAAYFITSKDQENDMSSKSINFKSPMSYIEMVANSLRDGNADYGFFHAKENWYAEAYGNPDEELCYDKRYIASRPEFVEKSKLVVRTALDLAFQMRLHPVSFDGGARKNRT